MRAAVWHGAEDIRVEDVEEPRRPGPGNAIVEVSVACICATDVAEYRDGPHVIPTRRAHPLTGRAAPLTLGHEYSGRVVAVAGAVDGLAAGDRVCGDACIRCGHCYWCLRGEYNICASGASVGLHADGAFARYLEVPAYTLYRVPDGVSDLQASIAEPLAVGLHALRRGGFGAGDTVAVFGFGMIGAAVAVVARTIGAGEVLVVERSAARREVAIAAGFSQVHDPETAEVRNAARALTEGRGADLIVDCTGSPTVLEQAIEVARRGGRVVLAGIGHHEASIAPERLVYFERQVIGSLGYSFDHPTVLQLLESGRVSVEPFLGPVISLEEIVVGGFRRLSEDASSPLRIPVVPG